MSKTQGAATQSDGGYVTDLTEKPTKRANLPFVVRLLNPVIARLLRLGLPMRPMILLTVRGRITGEPRATPVGLFEYNGKRYLFATFGEVNWVRNLRAARTAVLRLGRRSEELVAAELAPEEAVPFLKGAIAPLLKRPPGAWILRRHFNAAPEAPLNDFIKEAQRHPVFEVSGAPAAGPPSTSSSTTRQRYVEPRPRDWHPGPIARCSVTFIPTGGRVPRLRSKVSGRPLRPAAADPMSGDSNQYLRGKRA